MLVISLTLVLSKFSQDMSFMVRSNRSIKPSMVSTRGFCDFFVSRCKALVHVYINKRNISHARMTPVAWVEESSNFRAGSIENERRRSNVASRVSNPSDFYCHITWDHMCTRMAGVCEF